MNQTLSNFDTLQLPRERQQQNGGQFGELASFFFYEKNILFLMGVFKSLIF